MKYIANKSIERFTKFKEGDEVVGIAYEQLNVLELLGHARKVEDEPAQASVPRVEVKPESSQDVTKQKPESGAQRRVGRPPNAEREPRAIGAAMTKKPDA